jgi:hypothetical protein
MFDYVKEDGSPDGTPDDWQRWDGLLEEAKNRFEYQESDGVGFFYKRGQVDWDLTNRLRAKERAKAGKYRDILNSEHSEDYYRWYGDGANMTDEQWSKYRAGTLEMWQDKPNPREAQNRTQAMRLWAALTPEERNQYGMTHFGQQPVVWEALNEFGKFERRRGPLASYMQYINAYKVKRYINQNGKQVPLLGDIDPGPPAPVS